jgi:hypothetical protein
MGTNSSRIRRSYGEANAINNAIEYAKFFSRAQDALIRVYHAAGNVIEAHEHKGRFKRVAGRSKNVANTILNRVS